MSVFVTLKQLAGSYLATGYGTVYTVLKNFLAYFARYFCLAKEKEEKYDG